MKGLASTAIAGFLLLLASTLPGGFAVPAAGAATLDQNPCAPPTHMSPNATETAWLLWVAATCPVNSGKYPFVVWENWIEQAQMYPLNPKAGLVVPNARAAQGPAAHQFHHDPFAVLRNPKLDKIVPGLLGGADQDCNKAGKPPKNQPNLIICEEVRLNGAAEDYIAGNNLWNRPGQAQRASLASYYGEAIEFPAPAVEIKSDWIELTSIGLKCDRLPPGFAQSIHVETVNGNCFALAGMHLISKLLDQWVWATFEPQNPITNPFRCRVLGCLDTFGSRPTSTNGKPTALSPRLANLMAAANLAPEWKNYRLDGVQIGFFRPQLLGNSIIEGENVGMPLWQASCITCHDVSSVKSDGTDGITLLTSNPIGAPKPLPSKQWIRRDFVWSLFEACPGSVAQKCVQ